MSNKPQFSEHEEKGRFGEDYVRTVIHNGWRAIAEKRENDRGTDFVVRDVRANRMTSISFEIQVKTGNYNSQPGKTFRPKRIEEGHIQLWRESNVPVVLVCVDVGPPVTAFWHLIPTDTTAPLVVHRHNVFGPASRDAVIGQIRRAFRGPLFPAEGALLECPVEKGIRDVAKDYYYRELMRRNSQANSSNDVFGPVEFTWKGWKHITRLRRSIRKISSSLYLLPSIAAVLKGNSHPVHCRPLPTLRRGDFQYYKTLLVFERLVNFKHRAAAWLRVVVEAQATVRDDWATSLPRRQTRYKFLSLEEVLKPSAT